MQSPYIAQTGPLLMGSLLGFFLNGVFASQLFSYCSNFACSDRRTFRGLVALVVAAEILHLIFSTHTLYTLMAEGFGEPDVLLTAPFSGAAMPALNGTVGLCTQMFFAWRILRLNQSALAKIATSLIVLTACLQCSAAIGVTIQFTLLARDIALLQTLKTTVTIWLAGSFACDISISLTIAGILYFERLSLSYTPSKRIVDRLIVHTIENGLVTTICALVDLVVYLRLPSSWFYICFEVLLGRLYAVVLLAALNNRKPPTENLSFHCP